MLLTFLPGFPRKVLHFINNRTNALGAMQYLLYNRAGAESFLEPKKSQDPCRHNSAKIIGHCQYVHEKSVGPVGALTVGHSLNQLGSWGDVSPPASTRQVSGGGPGGKPPEALKILYFTIPK